MSSDEHALGPELFEDPSRAHDDRLAVRRDEQPLRDAPHPGGTTADEDAREKVHDAAVILRARRAASSRWLAGRRSRTYSLRSTLFLAVTRVP